MEKSKVRDPASEVLRTGVVGLIVAVLLAEICAQAMAKEPADWPCFRGGPAMTGVASDALPLKPKLLWAYEAGSPIHSTAAIVGAIVYVGTDNGELLAVGLADGKRAWKFDAGDAISAAPCVIGKTVFVGDEAGTFYAVDAATGRERWRIETGGKIASSATPARSSQSDRVLFGSYDNRLYCLEAETGKVSWTFEAEAQVHCSPCVADGLVMIAGCDGKVRVIDLASGTEKASAAVEANFSACPAYEAGHVYVGSLSGEYLSVNCRNGSVRWRMGKDEEEIGQCFAGAAVRADSVVFASRGNRIFCVSRETGDVRWTFRTKDKVDSSPVIARTAGNGGETVFAGCTDGSIYGLNLADGKKVWQFKAGAEIDASPAIGRGRLVIGTGDGALYCFGEDD